MNVVTPKLLPNDYGRANYLKREVQNAFNYMKQVAGKAPLLRAYFAAVAEAADPSGTAAVVVDNQTVVVKNSAGTTVAGTHTIDVVSGAVEDVNLAATVAPVTNGFVRTGVAPTGTYTSTVTFTVAGGVITGIALA